MVSNIDTAKRAFVTLLKSIAVIYGLVAGLTRESTDIQVRAAYKKVSRKAHPDKGGAEEHSKALDAARDVPLFLILSVQSSDGWVASVWKHMIALAGSRCRQFGCT